MSREGERRHAKARPPKPSVLIFGEGAEQNDQKALKELVEALLALGGLAAPPSVQAQGRPVSYPRSMDPNKKRNRLKEIAQLCEAKGGAVSVVVHRDGDQQDPELASRRDLLEEMAAAELPHPIAAVPIVDIECWWQSFPEELQQTVEAWHRKKNELKIPAGSTDTGKHSKSSLKEASRAAAAALQRPSARVIRRSSLARLRCSRAKDTRPAAVIRPHSARPGRPRAKSSASSSSGEHWPRRASMSSFARRRRGGIVGMGVDRRPHPGELRPQARKPGAEHAAHAPALPCVPAERRRRRTLRA